MKNFYLCSMSPDIKYRSEKTDLREFSFSDHKSFMGEKMFSPERGAGVMIQSGMTRRRNMHRLKSTE